MLLSVCLSEHAHGKEHTCACSDRQTDRRIHVHVQTDRRIHVHVQTDRRIHVHVQTDRRIETRIHMS